MRALAGPTTAAISSSVASLRRFRLLKCFIRVLAVTEPTPFILSNSLVI